MWETNILNYIVHKHRVKHNSFCQIYHVLSDITKLTLDPNTAHKDLSLSKGNRKATRWTPKPCPDHSDRFDFWRQVLCTEGLTGRTYWETEWTGRALIGVAYRSMCRKGEDHNSWLGHNNSSWCLSCTKDSYKTWHNGVNTPLDIPPSSGTVGVYLDWSAGTLSFYRVSCGPPTLLYTFHAAFTEPVYPGFQLGWVDSTIHLCWISTWTCELSHGQHLLQLSTVSSVERRITNAAAHFQFSQSTMNKNLNLF